MASAGFEPTVKLEITHLTSTLKGRFFVATVEGKFAEFMAMLKAWTPRSAGRAMFALSTVMVLKSAERLT